MKPINKIVVEAEAKKKYKTTENIGGVDFIVHTDIDIKDYAHTNRVGIVKYVPRGSKLKPGDRVLVHHNVFRSYWGFTGLLMESGSKVTEDEHGVFEDQVYAVDRGSGWEPMNDWLILKTNGEVYVSNVYPKGIRVEFEANSDYEVPFDGETYYRMTNQDVICSYEES